MATKSKASGGKKTSHKGPAAHLIRAHCKSDDNQIRVRFDAAGWFASVDDAAIRVLHASDYRGEAADEIAYHVMTPKGKGKSTAVDTVFRYLDAFKPRRPDNSVIGFEVTVNASDVANWLFRNRPTLAAELFPRYTPPELKSC